VSGAQEEIGYVHVHAPKPKPVAALEGVRFVDGRWEATVRRASGKRCWLYADNEKGARARALEEVRR
jgi:hypothetical protein